MMMMMMMIIVVRSMSGSMLDLVDLTAEHGRQGDSVYD
jgi:hypothetical protein